VSRTIGLRIMSGAARGALALAILLFALWAGLGLWFRLPFPSPVRGAFSAAMAVIALAAAISVFTMRRLRRLLAFAVVLAAFALWWASIRASNDRDWMVDVAKPATAEFHGDLVTIRNVRNFDYRSETDFDERWEERTYDLSKITYWNLFLSYWSSPAIAHTIASWEFSDGPPLAISIETRKEKTESYSSVRGFFREYELYYVVADERDVVRLRTNYRGETVFLYRIRASPELARALLVNYLEEIDRLARHPRWYNAATHNCTTAIRQHVKHVVKGNPFNWRILVNGYLDELMYERGTIDTRIPFSELKALSDITERAKAADQDPDFSARIRNGIPRP
jgi:hypothetical protein